LKKIPAVLKPLKNNKIHVPKSRGVFFEVAEAPQAARTQTHTAGTPETGKKGKFLATYDKSSTVSLTVSTFSKMLTSQNAKTEIFKYP